MNSQHLARYNNALENPVRFVLLDIDHNITDNNGAVPTSMYNILANLINNKNIGVGFVSGRPKNLTVPNSNDIQTVVDRLLLETREELHKNIMVFPEHCGYGFSPYTDNEYDFGFIANFDNSLDMLHSSISESGFVWLDFVETKKTSFALWIKPDYLDQKLMSSYVADVDNLIKSANLDKIFKSVNGANRTVDILQKNVDKSRSINEVAKIFNIKPEEVATFDDQAGFGDTGYLLTEHVMGFATKSYYPDSKNQISTKLAIDLTGVDAVSEILTNLKFLPL